MPDVVVIKALADFEPFIEGERAYEGLYTGQQRRAPREVARMLAARGLVEILDVPELVTNEFDQVKIRFVVAFEGWSYKQARWLSSTESVVEDCTVPSYSVGDELFVDRLVAADLLGQSIAVPVIKEQAQN